MNSFNFEDLDPADISYRILGDLNDHSKVLILIHGLQSSHVTFDNVIEDFHNQGYTVISYDQRGHGLTPRKGEDYRAQVMARDLKNFMDHLKIKKAYIVGHSMGGRTLMSFIDQFPEMVEKAIIEDMGIHKRISSEDDFVNEAINTSRKAHRPSNVFESREEVYKFIKSVLNDEEALWASRDKVKLIDDGRVQLVYHPDVRVLYGVMGNFEDMTEVMKNTSVPVLYLQAAKKNEAVLTDNCRRHILDNVPNANIKFMPESGHSIHKTHPKEFVKVVTDFIRE